MAHPRQLCLLHARVYTGDLIGDMQIKAYEGATPQHQFSLRSNYTFGQGFNLDLWARHVSQTQHYGLNALQPLVIRPYSRTPRCSAGMAGGPPVRAGRDG